MEKLFIKTDKNIKDFTNRSEFDLQKQQMRMIAEETNVHIVTEKHPQYDVVYETDLGFPGYKFRTDEL
jgi:hypothetical protein